MTETSESSRIVIYLGILFILIGLLYPGQESVWTDFQTTITEGVAWPTFENPYIQDLSSFERKVVSTDATIDDSYYTYGCSAVDPEECVEFNDGDSSYISIDALRYGLTVLPPPTNRPILNLVVNLWCRSNISFAYVIVAIEWSVGSWTTPLTPSPICKSGFTFQKVSQSYATNPADGPGNPWSWPNIDDNDPQIQFITGETDGVEITYITVDIVYYAVQTPCATGWWETTACALGRWFDGIINALTLAFNGIKFFVLSVAALIGFIFFFLIGFFGGLIGSLGWFLNLPNAPILVQSMVTAIFISLIAYLFLSIVRTIRGSEG